MPRATCRQELLDAAAAVVAESGAGHLTLDAVAEKAGVSKGGLLYHFPNKESLLVGLMTRHFEDCDARRAAALDDLANDNARELKAELLTFLEKPGVDARTGRGMLAAIANEPRLTQTLLERNRERFEALAEQPGSFERKTLVLLATMGLGLLEMLQVSPFNCDQRKALIDELMRLAEEASRPD
ncbi:MAG: TetR/AcrR family transcriptional regulator [Rhodospirillales bacterium]|jgi:AcrR family transcriptional regulator|nr:TetR/AcrR family transcriptional regulator [Rhodospirillales bacterium]